MLLSLRWCKRAGVCTIAALAIIASLAFASTGNTAGASGGVMLDVKDAPLAQVVLMLTQQSGINIVIADPEVNTKRITAHLSGLPLDKVLDSVLIPAGIRYHKTEDGIYVIGEGGSDVTQAVEPPVSQITQPQMDAEPVKPVRHVRTESIKLQNTSPSELLRVLGCDSGMQNQGGALTADPGVDVDQVFPWKAKTPGNERIHSPAGVVQYPNNNQNNDPAPPALDGTGLMGPGAGRTADTAEGAAQYPGASARPNYGGAYGRPGGQPYGGPGGRPGGAPQQPTSTGSGGLLPEGIDFVMPYDIDNSIVVRGDDEGIAEFKDLVHMLDIPPKQVRIEAKFVEVNTQDIDNFGIDWNIERLNTTFQTQFNPGGNVLLGFQAGNVSASLAAQLTNSKGRVVNAPIISTLNNTPAQISIGKTVPFFSSITQSVGEGQLVTSEQLVELPVQTYLFVLPRVNGDGSITLYLEPSIQDTGTIYKSGKGTQFPERSFQTVRTNRRVMNGETIVIGGFIRKKDSASVSRVPILGDLPIIRNFFRSRTRDAEERELLIFVTPEIIPDRSGGAIGVMP